MRSLLSLLPLALVLKGAQAGIKFDVGDLSGSDGFQFDGDSGDFTGTAVGHGDFNGDGYSDIIVSAPYGEGASSELSAGNVYVIFGTDASVSSPWDKTDLDGAAGFIIYGESAFDYLGASEGSISSANVNGDAYDDIIVGAYGAGNEGKAYIIYGSGSIGSSGSVYLSGLTASTGIVLSGAAYYDQFGYAVAGAGDINGDGYDDVIVGAIYADLVSTSTTYSVGKAYVVFGGASLTDMNMSSLSGSNGFAITGENTAYDYCGYNVAGAGDPNNDGYDDVLVSCHGGEYIMLVLGSATVGSSGSVVVGDLAGSGTDGCLWYSDDETGPISLDGGFDFNSDGYDDFIVGAPYNGNYNKGAAFVVYGSASSVCSSASNNFDDLDGSDGVMIQGRNKYDYFGTSVAGAGDVNEDGYDDVIVGAIGADVKATSAGAAYVVYGLPITSAKINIKNLDSSSGLIYYGDNSYDYIGQSVGSAGDFDNNSAPDLLIGAYYKDEFYLIFAGSIESDDDDKGDGGTGSISAGGIIILVILVLCCAGCLGGIIWGCTQMCHPQNNNRRQSQQSSVPVVTQAQVAQVPMAQVQMAPVQSVQVGQIISSTPSTEVRPTIMGQGPPVLQAQVVGQPSNVKQMQADV